MGIEFGFDVSGVVCPGWVGSFLFFFFGYEPGDVAFWSGGIGVVSGVTVCESGAVREAPVGFVGATGVVEFGLVELGVVGFWVELGVCPGVPMLPEGFWLDMLPVAPVELPEGFCAVEGLDGVVVVVCA